MRGLGSSDINWAAHCPCFLPSAACDHDIQSHKPRLGGVGRTGSLERPHLKSQRLGKKWILVIVSICTVPGVACWLPQDDFWHLRGSRKALKPLGRTKQSPGWQPPLPQPHARTHQYWPDKNHNSRGFPPFSGAIKPFPMMNHSNWTTNWLDGFIWIYGFSKHWKRVEAKRWIKLALLHVPHIATGTPCNSQVLENLLCFKHLWVLRKQARAGSQLNESQVAATAM